MGKKSKRKAAKAAAVAAGGATAVSGGSKLILGPRPDGIASTNDDPYACAVCSCAIPMKVWKPGFHQLNICCGTMVCTDCFSYERCCFCKIPWYQDAVASFAKKRSKEGFAWAQRFLGMLHKKGMPPFILQSRGESFRLCEKAADQGHPVSCIQLVEHLIDGFGCKRNLEKALVTFEKALRIPVGYDYQEVLVAGNDLSRALLENGKVEKGLSVLAVMETFAEKSCTPALGMLSVFYDRVEDFEGSWRCNKKSSESPDCPFSALASSINIENFCLVRMRFKVASKVDLAHDEFRLQRGNELKFREERENLLKNAHQVLCQLRQECAWCNSSIERSTRKLCKGCKAH